MATTTIDGERFDYAVNTDGDALVVVHADGTRDRFPFTGGCWTNGQQTTGRFDVRAPRNPSRYRAFVRRIYTETV